MFENTQKGSAGKCEHFSRTRYNRLPFTQGWRACKLVVSLPPPPPPTHTHLPPRRLAVCLFVDLTKTRSVEYMSTVLSRPDVKMQRERERGGGEGEAVSICFEMTLNKGSQLLYFHESSCVLVAFFEDTERKDCDFHVLMLSSRVRESSFNGSHQLDTRGRVWGLSGRKREEIFQMSSVTSLTWVPWPLWRESDDNMVCIATSSNGRSNDLHIKDSCDLLFTN